MATRQPRAADDDDASDRRDEQTPAARGARARERGRVKAIVTCPAAKLQPALAVHIALNTGMSRDAAIEFLTEIAGAVADPASPSMADAIIVAGRKARGEVSIPWQAPAQPRRGRPDPDLPARIVAAGRKARGEIE